MTGLRPKISGNNAASNQARELLWEHTVYQVICLLKEAERRIRSPEGRNRYTALRGWWRPTKARLTKGEYARIPSETALSEAIIGEIESLREEVVLKIAPDPTISSILMGFNFRWRPHGGERRVSALMQSPPTSVSTGLALKSLIFASRQRSSSRMVISESLIFQVGA